LSLTANDIILKIEALPADERRQVQDWLRAQDEAREDAIDVTIIEERKNEPTIPLEQVIANLKIDGLV
jgi:hypothetical protein